MPEVTTMTLLILHENGNETQIVIPTDWKVTYGPAVVGLASAERSGKRVPMALRIYETEKLQRAIFTDVVSFRDMSIPIKVKKVNVKEKDGYMEMDGIRKHTTFQARTTEWVNPDEEDSNSEHMLNMPRDAEIFNELDD